jgi:endonuclease/exonuclease/phosphatase family metal-dependent hydrolase
LSCVAKWDCSNVIVAGDFNDGLSFTTTDGQPAGLCKDFLDAGFIIKGEELEKKTCNSFNGNVYNVDHVLSRQNVVSTFIPLGLDIMVLPSAKVPSDHLPILYELSFKKV